MAPRSGQTLRRPRSGQTLRRVVAWVTSVLLQILMQRLAADSAIEYDLGQAIATLAGLYATTPIMKEIAVRQCRAFEFLFELLHT